ncbi:MAG TPA: alkaline phosphatase family protein [Gemmatimonadaceae bacterium]|nr:alkaline phosphatase family protein [Gemmatimonadaceae bacterium]
MTTADVRRVVVVVLDGLRPDAITTYALPNVLRLARNGASTFHATTVAPSVTAVAMASLLTGAEPERHGLLSDRFHLPRPTGAIHPLPRELHRFGLPSSGFMAHVPWLMRPLAGRITAALGFGTARFRGAGALDVLATARRHLETQRTGLIFMHWPDADRAGHATGWMSAEYESAARTLDEALGRLVRVVDLSDTGTMVVALADHGGGGSARRHHNSDHPLDRTIPIIFAGGAVRPGTLGDGMRLIDVPPTVLAALGLPTPDSYGGVALMPRRERMVAESVTAGTRVAA